MVICYIIYEIAGYYLTEALKTLATYKKVVGILFGDRLVETPPRVEAVGSGQLKPY